MAPPKKRGKVCESAEYYRKNKNAREKKKAYDTKLNSSEQQRAKRRELSKKNYAADKKGVDRTGKDLSHTKSGTRYKDSSKNRGSKKDTAGDRRARSSK